ncbi:hypothetical protein EYF80_014806 [Liparis tanakae]|uniref:Uncharacterized protein n=1 Tax=Liparis tanakae TaxID=230148 RepID=A0A4Z2IB00_9TELE|nr:hypothetical protein EYF80_014806 [Liparis tanakae]
MPILVTRGFTVTNPTRIQTWALDPDLGPGSRPGPWIQTWALESVGLHVVFAFGGKLQRSEI